MQEGSLRADANVNLHIDNDGKKIATPIVEVKNLNSFRAVERALTYESQRQYDEWRRTGNELGSAPKRTFGWDDVRGVTFPQREKEESSDYRYFPDPDLVPLYISDQQLKSARDKLGESPQDIRQRLVSKNDLKAYDADVIVSQGRGVVEYFDQLIASGASAKRASSWVQQEVLRVLNESQMEIVSFPINAQLLASLLEAIESGDLDTTRGKEVFQYWLEHPNSSVQEAKDALGIKEIDQSEIEELCRILLAENPKIVQQFKEGNTKALGALIGAAKKKNPNADPRLVRQLSQSIIENEL
jgi:aspartyl-tRNA(Asn)/glutamyl-tRNA(Gln) amidotransferase subunit B